MENISKQNRWDASNVMGSKALFNIVTGARTFGKTYAMKKNAKITDMLQIFFRHICKIIDV